jgi:hypothetical protein
MPLKRDLSHLPEARTAAAAGNRPDATPRFGHILAERWMANELAEGKLPRAHPDARFRHSDAGNCARAIGYAAIDLPESNPMDLPGYWVIQLGRMIHEAWQSVLPERFPGAAVEVKVHEGRRAGHVDAAVRIPGEVAHLSPDCPGIERETVCECPLTHMRVVAIEGKSVGGYKYQLAVGAKGNAQGPGDGHVIQAAMNGLMLDADEVVVVYWARDAISVQQAGRKGFTELERFTAEWTFTREQYEPIARAEIERVEKILALVDEGMLPGRAIPGLPPRSLVVRPEDGSWVSYDERGQATDSGTAWQCAYCRWQDTCAGTRPGRTPIEEVTG